MAKKLYLDCQSGISGDMLVGALLDLGASEKILKDTLKSLPLEGFEIEISRVEKGGLSACDFLVKLDAAHENYDHDMKFLHGKEGGEHEPHMHRGFSEVVSIIQSGKLTKRAKELAVKIFRILGEAEAKAHGTTLEEVHFHEVGAVDSIVDIVAFAVCFDNLGIKKVAVPVLCEGCGTVNSQHGILSIPVPAVANIIEKHQLVIQMTSVEGELITPTGAAIAAAVCTDKELPQKFSIVKSGIGAGKREYERPSLLRAMMIDTLGEPEEVKKNENEEVIVKLECNVDDCGGEAFGYCMEQLFAAGARDVFYIPVYMKKNRPAYEVEVICEPQDVEKMEAILFTETTTIGIRRTKMERTILKRNIITMESSFGPVQIKVCEFQDTKWGYPEYESIKKIAMKQGVSYLEVYQVVHEEVTKLMEKENKKKKH